MSLNYFQRLNAVLNPEGAAALQKIQENEAASNAFAQLQNLVPGGPQIDGPPSMEEQGQSALLKLAQANPQQFGPAAAEAMSPGQQLDNLVKRAQAENVKSDTIKNETHIDPAGGVHILTPQGEFKTVGRMAAIPVSDAGKIAFDAANQPALAGALNPQQPQGQAPQAQPAGPQGYGPQVATGGASSGNPLMDSVREAMMPPSARKALEQTRADQAGAIEAARQKMLLANQNAEALNKTLDKLTALNPNVPSGPAGLESLQEDLSNASGMMGGPHKWAKAGGEWDQINSKDLVSGITSLSSSGGPTRFDLPIAKSVIASSGISKALPPDARLAMINNLRTEAETTRQQAHNNYLALTGSATAPLPTFSGAASPKVFTKAQVQQAAANKKITYQKAAEYIQSNGGQIQ